MGCRRCSTLPQCSMICAGSRRWSRRCANGYWRSRTWRRAQDGSSGVLVLRPAAAPPTESLLETLMVQLARTVPGLGPPVRQLEVFDEHGQFVARVDLAWPELGLFIELDGQQHTGQPVYDARRETAVV